MFSVYSDLWTNWKKSGPVGAPRRQAVLQFSDVPVVLLFLWLVETSVNSCMKIEYKMLEIDGHNWLLFQMRISGTKTLRNQTDDL